MVFWALRSCPDAIGVDGNTIVILRGQCRIVEAQEVLGGLMEVAKSLYPLESLVESVPGLVYVVRDVGHWVIVVLDSAPPAAHHGWWPSAEQLEPVGRMGFAAQSCVSLVWPASCKETQTWRLLTTPPSQAFNSLHCLRVGQNQYLQGRALA